MKEKKYKKEEFHFLNETVNEKKHRDRVRQWLNVILSGVLVGLIACGVFSYVIWNVQQKNAELEADSADVQTVQNEEVVWNMDIKQWLNSAKKNFVKIQNPADEEDVKTGMIYRIDNQYIYIVSEIFEQNDEVFQITYDDKAVAHAKPNQVDNKIGINLWKINVRSVDSSIYNAMSEVAYSKTADCKQNDAVMVVTLDGSNNICQLLGTLTSVTATVTMEDGIYDMCATDVSNIYNKSAFVVNEAGELVGMSIQNMNGDKFKNHMAFVKIQSVRKEIEHLIEDKARAALGVEGVSVTQSDMVRYGDNVTYGVWISKVTEGSAAYDGGIMSGDIITYIDDYVVLDLPTMKDLLLDYKAGDVVTIRFLREYKNGYKECSAKVTLE